LLHISPRKWDADYPDLPDVAGRPLRDQGNQVNQRSILYSGALPRMSSVRKIKTPHLLVGGELCELFGMRLVKLLAKRPLGT
jgi:hypothetical protein